MYLFIRLILVLHITGVIIMAGTTLIDYVTFKTFWQLVDQGDARFAGLIPLMAKYGAFIRAGGAMIILTGIIILILENGIWWGAPQFRVKLVLVILLVLNGMFVGNTYGSKLRETVSANAHGFLQHTMDIRETLNRFYPIQLLLFFLIILLSMIRFDKIGS